MIFFMNDLDSNGKPLHQAEKKNAHCQICGFTSPSTHGLRVHMAIHRDGTTTSYHTKDGLYKSGRHTYET